MPYKRVPIKINPFLDLEEMELIIEAAEGAKAVIDVTYDVITTGLNAAKIYFILQEDVFQLIIEQIMDLISGLIDTGIGMTYIIPTQDHLYSTKECFGLLAGSVLDNFDASRPITQGESADINLLILLGRAPTFTEIKRFFDAMVVLFDFLTPIDDFLEGLEGFPDPAEKLFNRSQQSFPDWNGIKLGTHFGPLSEALQELQALAKSLFPQKISISRLIDSIIEIIENKKQAAQELLDNLRSIIEAIEALAALNGLLDMIHVYGTHTQESLAQTIQNAYTVLYQDQSVSISPQDGELVELTAQQKILSTTRTSAFGELFEDVCLMFALSTTDPATGDILLSLFADPATLINSPEFEGVPDNA